MVSEESMNKELLENILPVAFIKDKYITDGKKPLDYSYEDYLIEFLNCSEFFMGKTKGEIFQKARDQSHGEADAITQEYDIDFKLILGTSMQYAKNLAEEQIHVLGEGVVGYSISKEPGRHEAIWLHRALRQFSKEALEDLLTENPTDMTEKDVKSFLKSIDKDKNLFLLYPILFEYTGEEPFEVSDICNAIYDDYNEALKLQRNKYADKETYIAFFYADRIIIAVLKQSSLNMIESIRVDNSQTFIWLMSFYGLNQTIKKIQDALRSHKMR